MFLESQFSCFVCVFDVVSLIVLGANLVTCNIQGMMEDMSAQQTCYNRIQTLEMQTIVD